jgi:flagellar biosynthesis GTPase FlhF
LKIRQAKQAEKERLKKEELKKQRLEKEELEKKRREEQRLKKEELEKQGLEKEQLEKKRKEEQRLEIMSARQKDRLREIAPQAAQLSRWQQWVRKYRENLSSEGFTLSDGLWRRPINSDDIENTVTFKDADAKKLSDIPFEFHYVLGDPAYGYVSWDRIRYEHIWYSEREENLLDLGFVKMIGWKFTCLSSFSSFQVPNFEGTVWRGPGADDNENLNHIHPPEDFSPYQILDLAGFDKPLLDGVQEQQYRKDLNRLPSAQLGHPRYPLQPWSRVDMKLWWFDEASRTSKCIEMPVHFLFLT